MEETNTKLMSRDNDINNSQHLSHIYYVSSTGQNVLYALSHLTSRKLNEVAVTILILDISTL